MSVIAQRSTGPQYTKKEEKGGGGGGPPPPPPPPPAERPRIVKATIGRVSIPLISRSGPHLPTAGSVITGAGTRDPRLPGWFISYLRAVAP